MSHPTVDARVLSACARPALARQRGLTLIESLMAVVLLALILGLGLPSLQTMLDSNRVARQASWLQSDLRLARAEAVRRGAPVGLCTSTNGTSCTAAASWRQGWIVFSNARGDGAFDPSVGDQILRIQRAWSGGDTATTTPFADRLAFNGEGFAAVLRGGNTTITIRAASAPVSSTRCLVLNMAGTVSMQGGGACP